MFRKKPPYATFFKAGQQVKFSLHYSETKYRELSGELISVQDDRCRVELLGEGIATDYADKGPVAKVVFSGWSGWGFFRCDAILEGIFSEKEIGLRLVGPVEEKQRREYFRLDVVISVLFSVPDAQHMSALEAQWQENKLFYRNSPPPEMIFTGRGYRVITAGGDDITPQNVNLSGGGLKIRRSAFIPPGTKVNANLFLPVAPARTICTVAEILRCNEITLRLDKDPSFITAMKFLFIDETDREAIIAYIFAEQRNMLKAEIERSTPSTRIPD
jgi:hypothetical protein